MARHFATALSKVANPYLMYLQNQLFRERGLGSFGDLLQRVARDPAMLVWLDGSANRKAHPNENFAREVMELFTIGRGQYTEKDVQEAARAFSGWHLRDDTFFFNANEHDPGPKTVLGQSGNLDGSDVLDTLAHHPATAERLTSKLFSFFVFENPEPQVVAPFAQVWRSTHGDIRETLRAMFLSPVFSSDRAYRAQVKSPAEFVIGSIRSLGGTINPRQVVSWMARMGQDLFNPPSVKGWDGGRAWVSTSTLFERFNFAASITTARGPKGTSHIEPDRVFAGVAPTTSRQMVDLAVDHLLDSALPAPTRQALVAYLETPDPQRVKELRGQTPTMTSDVQTRDEKVRGLIHLLLSTPDFQLS